MKTIILLGDSILAREHQDNVTALPPRLAKAFPGIPISNYAQGGTNSRQTLEALRNISLPEGGLVIVSIGMNDAAPWKMVSLKEFTDNYDALLDACTPRPVIVVTPYPVSARTQQPPGRNNATIKQYAHAVAKLGKAHHAQTINLYTTVGRSIEHGDVHIADGVHLNNIGYTLFFENLKPAIAAYAAG